MPDSHLMQRPRILSGMRPTGRLHLGNYMGALHNWVGLQNEVNPETGEPRYECFFFIADLHALTTDYADPSRLKQNVYEVALDFLSAGLDPEKSTIFVQSHVPQHAELHLLLSMITPLSWLERVPSYKDQQEQLREKDLATYGFLGYPLLQSADILLYRPAFVPVGADQVAHVEITREIARRFNFLYPKGGRTDAQRKRESAIAYARWEGENLLPEPEVLLTPSPKLPGTDGRKMSKSYNNAISLSDPPLMVLEKTHAMTNGGQRPTQRDPGDPDICPVGDLHRVFSQVEVDSQIREGCRNATITCEACKYAAGSSINEHLAPIRIRREELIANPEQAWTALDRGYERAIACAETTMSELREVTGLSRDRSGVRLEASLAGEGAQGDPRNLRQFADEEVPEGDRPRDLREYWFNKVRPTKVELKFAGDSVWLTRKNQRVYVGVSEEDGAGTYKFMLKPKSCEFLILLCWSHDNHLVDFLLPQKLFVGPWSAAKKFGNKTPVDVTVRRVGDSFEMSLFGGNIDLTGTQANYEPISS